MSLKQSKNTPVQLLDAKANSGMCDAITNPQNAAETTAYDGTHESDATGMLPRMLCRTTESIMHKQHNTMPAHQRILLDVQLKTSCSKCGQAAHKRRHARLERLQAHRHFNYLRTEVYNCTLLWWVPIGECKINT